MLNKLEIILIVSIVIFGIVSLFSVIGWFLEDDEDARRVFKRFFPYFIGIFCLYILVPSQKTFGSLVVIPLIMESKVIQEDMPEIYEMAVEGIKKNLQDQISSENKN